MDRPFPWLSASFRTTLACFVALDICFILIHAGGWTTFRLGLTGEIPHLFRISEDRSIPESFNYVKWAILVVSLTWLGIRSRWNVPLAWAVVFLLMLLDDSLQVHESVGVLFAQSFHFAEGALLEPGDLGELLYAVLMGGLVAGLAGWAVLRADGPARQLSMTYLLVIIAFGFFSVVMDAAHRAVINSFPHIAFLQDFFALIEEGGEMLVASTAAALTLAPPTWRLALSARPAPTTG
jgi:hypothetical protein